MTGSNPKKIKVLILGTRGFPDVQGGVEKHCENLSIQLVNIGCDVSVFTRRPYIKRLLKTYKGVRLIKLPAVRHKALETFLHTLLGVGVAALYRPDILHIQGIGPALFTPLAKLLGMRVVVTTHGSNYKHLKWGRIAKFVLLMGEKLGVAGADSLIAISSEIAGEVKKNYQREPVVIPNGVSIGHPSRSNDILKKFALEKNRYILSVGRLVPVKGFETLIDSFCMLGLPGWKLVIAGQADHKDKYSAQLLELANTKENLIFTGFLKENQLNQLYCNAGLFVLPSYYEGLPIALLEAMSSGLSCIASDIPGNRNVISNQDRLFNPGHTEDLSIRIKRFIDKPLDKREKKAQMTAVRSQFNWDVVAAHTRQVYYEVLNRDQSIDRTKLAFISSEE